VTPNSRRLQRAPVTLAALVIIATLLGPALAASAAKTTSRSTTTTTKPSLECSAPQLSFAARVRSLPRAAAGLHDHAHERERPVVSGPRLSPGALYTSKGRLLTFTYKHTSPYFTHASPRSLNLAPHAHAYFEVAKSRCATGNRYLSSFFYVLAPYTAGSPWVGHVSGSEVSRMDYCKGSSRGPGQSLDISPIVSSPTQL